MPGGGANSALSPCCRPAPFFYGMAPGEEISVDLEAGKTLAIRCQAIGELEEDGSVRVFYELNGQPRAVKVPDRTATAAVDRHPKADPDNPDHVAAPMPGLIATVAVTEGQHVQAGDMLLTIEAMKMETALHAERAGTIAHVHVMAGMQVDAKDLMLDYAAA